MLIRRIEKEEWNNWLEMRTDLWPDCPEEKHFREMTQIYNREGKEGELETEILVCVIEDGSLGGFIELSLRDKLNKFRTSPVGYIEGWYVKNHLRGKGLGKELVKVAERWAIEKGCKEMASDAEKENEISILAHRRLAYIQYDRNEEEVLFRKHITCFKEHKSEL